MRSNSVVLLTFILILASVVIIWMPNVEAQLTQEIIYDDGAYEEGGSYSVGKHLAVKFSLPHGWSEAKLLRARYYILSDSTSFKVHIYDSDGITELTPPLEATPTGKGWFDVDLSGLNIHVMGDFYITIEYETDYRPSIGVDKSPPIDGRSYFGEPGSWNQDADRDHMIRVVMQQIAHAPIYQGDLILTGNDVALIEGRFDINGSIIIEGNATLTLRNAFLNFTQNYYHQHSITLENSASGKPQLNVYNSTITSNLGMSIMARDNSTVTISNSIITILIVAEDYSDVSISNSTVNWEWIGDQAIVKIYNSTIHLLEIYHSAEVWADESQIIIFIPGSSLVEYEILNLKPGFVGYWNFLTNCSVEILSGGYAPNITLTETSVTYWNPYIYGTSNISICNSTLGTLFSPHSSFIHAVDSAFTHSLLNIRGTSILSLVNSTYIGEPRIGDQAKILVAWYLDVHVVDSIGQNVPSAHVAAFYLNGTMTKSEATDANGWARLTLMEKMLNASGSFSVGDYNIEATYNSHSNGTTVSMMGNQQITLTLEDFVIPEYPSFLIPLLLLAAASLVAAYLRRRHISQRLQKGAIAHRVP